MEFRWQEGEEEAEYTVYAKAWGDENLEVFRRGAQIIVGGFFLWDHRIPGKKWQGISGRKNTGYTEEIGSYLTDNEETNGFKGEEGHAWLCGGRVKKVGWNEGGKNLRDN